MHLYPNNLKNWFLTASAWQHLFCLRSRLALEQCRLLQTKKSAPPPGQIPNFSSCLGILRLFCGIFLVLPCFLFTSQSHQHFVQKELPTIAGWCSPKKAKAMMDLIFETTPEICVELGVFGGASLFPTAYALKALNHGTVYGIDAWDSYEASRYYPIESTHRAWWATQKMDIHYQNCLALVAKHGLKPFCTLLKETFAAALHKIPPIDILHIDATHTSEGDAIDAIPYIQKVKKMGYIWFDGWSNSFATYDYLKSRCHVKQVIDSGKCILLQKIVED